MAGSSAPPKKRSEKLGKGWNRNSLQNKLPISSEKEAALQDKMKSLGLFERDIEESFVRSSGAGGQHVNKTSTCVQLFHRPSGLLVKCQEDRSQAVNRYLARRILLERFEAGILKRKTDTQQKWEKIRRQKRRRSRRAKENMLQDKHHRTGVLRSRRVQDDM
jgi:protein subunit release factor B